MQLDKFAKTAVQDIVGGAFNWRLWSWLGWKDTRLRYRRTLIGPFWQTLSMAIFVGALGFLYSNFWNMEVSVFIPYLTAGMTAWILINTIVTESTAIFVASTPFIMQKGMPYSTFVYQVIHRNVVVFFHNLIVFVLVMVVFGVYPTVSLLFLIPSLALFMLNALWVALLVGTLCTRFRDFGNLIVSILQIIFFITPVFWIPEQAGSRKVLFVDPNPFYHFIELIRAPLLGHPPTMMNWAVTIGTLVVGSCLTLIIFGRFRSRIPYWI
ncbi:ABC transporter permease [Rhodospirillaceae bacterium KN72]|uniref:ABC transporter permease n=1 Tax=Pacificispira spongiicola TaxID=2729598 RepID=A0A7Y0HGB2_9PROT|nr:ABC transporter permease [Pacificispira spongiicola]NMM46730.1 ABC transporter permease [Pacificispira spongiicola]